ncbi:M23 family metallopeptidase [Candidatus Peregrinibacteria bacterium]|jgi:murein DD-endopeptidase MepM/ murein hydrolase activator NlpD|nr:M23 family metallopeptidase [Candidatus Peregrinibacteria bacterium]MBT5468080.1 M23 family metallopeptidase [Candidatus Peregrinibacteria bacterium]MBT7337346.1 M23 family metallopeptidase [Candidatus Peregrinibacteria bacterium]
MALNIEISRPISMLLIVGGMTFGLSSMMTEPIQKTADIAAVGGSEDVPQLAIHTAEDEMRRDRIGQELTERHIDVLKYQLKRLEAERNIMQAELTPELNEEFRQALRSLVELIEGKRRADAKMVESFQQMWEARRAGMAAAALSDIDPNIYIEWPVKPMYGISAIFDDPEYEQFFGFKHNAIDIPALQGTTIGSAEDGVVEEVVDNGMGYSYITVRHNGYVTLYGHVSGFLVSTGDTVLAGAPIAYSGGMPGTPGAGNLSTGPHVHFELIAGDGHLNPLPYLPAAGVQLRK